MTDFEEIYGPIEQMNDKLQEVSEIARERPGLVLAGLMLNQLRVAAIGSDFLVLRPTKQYFYKSMLKREDKILQAIKLVLPDIVKIKITEAIE